MLISKIVSYFVLSKVRQYNQAAGTTYVLSIGLSRIFIEFLLLRSNQEACCSALVMPPRHIVLYAFVDITARAL